MIILFHLFVSCLLHRIWTHLHVTRMPQNCTVASLICSHTPCLDSKNSSNMPVLLMRFEWTVRHISSKSKFTKNNTDYTHTHRYQTFVWFTLNIKSPTANGCLVHWNSERSNKITGIYSMNIKNQDNYSAPKIGWKSHKYVNAVANNATLLITRFLKLSLMHSFTVDPSYPQWRSLMCAPL